MPVTEPCAYERGPSCIRRSTTTTDEAISTAKTRIERDFDPKAVRQMKSLAGRDLIVGGAELAARAFEAGLVDECHVQGSSASLDAKTRKPCKTTIFPDASLRAGMQRLGLLTCRSQVRIPPGATICPSPAATTLGAAFRKNAVPCCRRCLCDRLATSSSRRGRAWWQERAECG
jgi:hypothetical protein